MPNLDQDYRDKNSPVWDMSQERVLMEQLVGQRFNYFMIFVGIVVAGSVNARSQLHMQLLLTLGAFVSIVLAKALNRTSTRLDAVLEILREDPTHPYTIISAKVGGQGVRRTLWKVTPTICALSVCVATVASWVNILKVVAPK